MQLIECPCCQLYILKLCLYFLQITVLKRMFVKSFMHFAAYTYNNRFAQYISIISALEKYKEKDLALLLSLFGFAPCHANKKIMATCSLSFL